MAKFVSIGKKFLNLENVDYIEIGEEESSPITVCFGGQGEGWRTLKFSGDDAAKLWEMLEEENILGTCSPRQ
ncbi:MAG TPA: hypothetical protein VGJ94_14395 [Syntrophorhabdaceae bacterium]|jgi:hypothetical protein